MKVKVDLITLKDAERFVQTASRIEGSHILTDGKGFTVNAKSLLGALYTTEWDETYLETDESNYMAFKSFIVE